MLSSPQIFEVQGKLGVESSSSSHKKVVNVKSLREPLNKQITVVNDEKGGNVVVSSSSSQMKLPSQMLLNKQLFSLPSTTIHHHHHQTTSSSSKLIIDLEEEISNLEERIGRQELYGKMFPTKIEDYTIFHTRRGKNGHHQQKVSSSSPELIMSELKDAWAKLEHVLESSVTTTSSRNSSSSLSNTISQLLLHHQKPEQLLQSTLQLCQQGEELRKSWMNMLRELQREHDEEQSEKNNSNNNMDKHDSNKKILDELENQIDRMESAFQERRGNVLEKLKELEEELKNNSASVVMEW